MMEHLAVLGNHCNGWGPLPPSPHRRGTNSTRPRLQSRPPVRWPQRAATLMGVIIATAMALD